MLSKKVTSDARKRATTHDGDEVVREHLHAHLLKVRIRAGFQCDAQSSVRTADAVQFGVTVLKGRHLEGKDDLVERHVDGHDCTKHVKTVFFAVVRRLKKMPRVLSTNGFRVKNAMIHFTILAALAHRRMQDMPSTECVEASIRLTLLCPDAAPVDEDFLPAKSIFTTLCATANCADNFRTVMTECFEMTSESRAALSTVCSGTCDTTTARSCNERCDACLYETFAGDEDDPPACVESCWTCIPYYHCATGSGDDPCFPGDAMLTTPLGSRRAREVRAYDAVLARSVDDGLLRYERVSPLSIAWTDATPNSLVRINATGDVSLVVTKQHRLSTGAVCCANLTFARDVSVGDTIHGDANDTLCVTSVEPYAAPPASGLYSPVLVDGGLPIVDGVVTSPGTVAEMRALRSVGGILHHDETLVHVASLLLGHRHPTLLHIDE